MKGSGTFVIVVGVLVFIASGVYWLLGHTLDAIFLVLVANLLLRIEMHIDMLKLNRTCN